MVGGVPFFSSVRGGSDFLAVGGGQGGGPHPKKSGGGWKNLAAKNVVSRKNREKWPIFSAAYCKIPENITISMPALAGEEKSDNFN